MKMYYRATGPQKAVSRLVLRLGAKTTEDIRWMAPWHWALRLRVMR